MTYKQTRPAPRARRLKEPRWLIVAAGVTFMVILTALAFVQQPTVAAPPPPLRGPFRFVEVPAESQAARSSDVVWTPFYTQTFADNTVYTDPKWNRYENTADLPTWGRVLAAPDFPAARLVNTLGAWLDPAPGNPADYTVRAGDTYSKNMDAWAVYGPLDTSQYASFQAKFAFYLDAEPGTYFGWAASSDGTTFCGQTMSGHLPQWITMTFDLPDCTGARPVYLAFNFKSSATETPIGLGAFVDNVVISGMPWYRTFMPGVQRFLPTIMPTPDKGKLVRDPFTFEGSEDPRWCENDNDNNETGWMAVLESVGSGSRGKSYRLATYMTGRTMLQSNHFDPGVSNYGIETEFSLLNMGGIDLTKYVGTKFGIIFGVEGNNTDGYPLDPWDDSHCTWYENEGGYYRAFIRVNDAGTGYEYKLQKVWLGGKTDLDSQTNPSVSISATDWNTMRVNRSGSTIQVLVNGIQVLAATDNTWTGSRWWGFMIDEPSGYSGNQPFRVNWDNTGVYDLDK